MILILGTSGMFLLTTAIVLFIYLYQRKLLKRKLEYQEIEDLLKKQELKSAYSILEGQERAYKQVAEELHDNLGSMLVTLNMLSDTLPKKSDPESLKSLAAKISEIAAQATEATRKISHSLHSGLLKHFGLGAAINELIGALNESQTIQVTSHIDLGEEMDSQTNVQVYRIVQELLNNTLKHARASTINIDLTLARDHFTLIFEDNGIGFDTNQADNGLGLKNLRSRVDRMDGHLTIESNKGKGTTTIIELPI
ncbi:sensor histidine kinase [Reichenbachiella sp.]|uniref:sensor histidine kinase n=1 Tax=Reichenbachiella sp. TaxID=2184521 RepID=UPI003B5BF36C